jgi:hypothetical protein
LVFDLFFLGLQFFDALVNVAKSVDQCGDAEIVVHDFTFAVGLEDCSLTTRYTTQYVFVWLT